jgi:hypothetical protein
MRALTRSFFFTLCGSALLTVGTAIAAEPSPPIRLRIPFANAFTQDVTASTQFSLRENCRISGEQAMRIDRDSSNPCLAADAAPGGACFDRLGLGMLRAQRALWPHDEGRHCME